MVFISPSVAEVSINVNDNAAGVIMFQPVSDGSTEMPVTHVNEDTYTTAKFTVLRTAGTFGEVSVGWTLTRAGGSAVPVEQDVGPLQGKNLQLKKN